MTDRNIARLDGVGGNAGPDSQRACLTVDETAQLAAQHPTLMRGA